MLYALIVGALLGANSLSPLSAIAIAAPLVLLKGAVEVAFKKSLITGSTSPYILYLERLALSGPLPPHPWRAYMAQVLSFGLLIAALGYAGGRLMF